MKLFLSLVLLLPIALKAETLTITTEDSPPFSYKNEKGEIVGAASDVVAEMMKRSNIQMTHQLLPWARAYAMGKDDANTCVYSTTETEERMPLFKWVGPLVKNEWVVLAPSDSTLNVTKLEDLKGKAIGGYLGDAVALYLKGLGYKVDEAPKDDDNIKKLANKRIEVWATGTVGLYLAKKQGVTNLKKILSFKSTVLSLACSKTTSDETIKKLNDTLKAMQADGTVEKIQKNY